MSRQATRFALVEEVAGAIPATPAYDLMRLTNDSLARTEERSDQQEFGSGARGIKSSILMNNAAAGTVGFTLHRSAWLEKLLSAVLGDDWGDDPLGLGDLNKANQAYTHNKLRTFALEKRYIADDTPTYKYDRFTGVMANVLTLDVVAGEEIQGTFDFVATKQESVDTEITGSSYNDAGTYPGMTAPKVSAIEILDSGGTPIPALAGACITTANYTLTNNGSAFGCIGTEGTPNKQLNVFEANVELNVVYSGHALEALADGVTDVQIHITMADGVGNSYRIELPRCHITEAVVVAGDPDATDPLLETAVVKGLIGSDDYVAKIERVNA